MTCILANYIRADDRRWESFLLGLTGSCSAAFLIYEFYKRWQGRLSSEEWRKRNGYLRYPAYDSYPDLSVHNNLMAAHLVPEIYEKLKKRSTPGCFTLEKLIQVGVDRPGKPWEHSSGVIAGDEETYTVFAPLLDNIIQDLHDYGPDDKHTRDIKCDDVGAISLPSTHVKMSRITAWRSLKGYRLPAACGRMERRQIEQAVRGALRRLKGDFKGEYYTLLEIPDADREYLTDNMLMPLGTAAEMTCSDRSRDWPDARGVFISGDRTFVVHVNEADHLKVIVTSESNDLLAAFEKYCKGLEEVEQELKRNDEEFIWSDHLGYVVSDPAHLGTAMEMRVRVRLHHFSTDCKLSCVLKALKFRRSRQGIPSIDLHKGEFDCCSIVTLGLTEAEVITKVAEGVAKLVQIEEMMDEGQDTEDVLVELVNGEHRGHPVPNIPALRV